MATKKIQKVQNRPLYEIARDIRKDWKNPYFGAKPYLDAEKLVNQEENYKHLGEIEAMYEEAKVRYEAAMAEAEAKAQKEKAEAEAYAAQLKAEKAAKKASNDKQKVKDIRMLIFMRDSGKITQEEYKARINKLFEQK